MQRITSCPEFIKAASEGDESTVIKHLQPTNVYDMSVFVRDDKQPRMTGLMHAARNGHIGVVNTLLNALIQQPASAHAIHYAVDTLDDDGHTALMHAAMTGQSAIVARMLHSKACDPRIKTPDDKSAADLASQNKHPEIAELINQAITRKNSTAWSREVTKFKLFHEIEDEQEPLSKKRKPATRKARPGPK